MNGLAKMALKRGMAFNQALSERAANSVDWLFKRDTLIKSGRTWFELVHDGELMSVRYYELPEEDEIELADGTRHPIERKQHAVPLVLVPPLGVTTETFDLLPQRSLVRYMVAAGFKVYLIDWGKPKEHHAGLGLADYSYSMMSTALEKIRKHSGSEDLSLMGWCLGGLLGLLYQGQAKDPHVRNIVTVASPIDLQAGAGVVASVAGVAQALDGPAQLISNYSNFRLNTLDPARLSLPPWATTLVFKLTDPLSTVTTYLDLVTRLGDREFVVSHSTTSDYLNNMLRYPGGVLNDMRASVLLDNQLAKGRVTVGERVAELDKIECSLLAFAGETDHLVPPDVAASSVDVVASRDTEFRLAPGGHMGVILGSRAQKAVWAESAEWLAERSAARSGAAARKNKKAAATRRKPAVKAGARAGSKPAAKAKARPKARPKVRPKARPKARAAKQTA